MSKVDAEFGTYGDDRICVLMELPGGAYHAVPIRVRLELISTPCRSKVSTFTDIIGI